MRSTKPHIPSESWIDQFSAETNTQTGWLDSYRRHLSWIKTPNILEPEDLFKDIVTDL
ncbi:MAG: hypothetical protein IPO78_09630 [Saprospiraceae bacterium]|nr:hypothetical protein [Saprospiraceae bacterium]MBK8450146.1 hypothetical protein [Saprospiraceae bacterium]MBK8483756.1 hypothetical protein [Saprospiraceae bacterium]MBK9221208.1 hypothetical protein [Saprospiraceae bacterium]MBK9721857.1 hypothetical protein [Saprospiraceae bacterium]